MKVVRIIILFVGVGFLSAFIAGLFGLSGHAPMLLLLAFMILYGGINISTLKYGILGALLVEAIMGISFGLVALSFLAVFLFGLVLGLFIDTGQLNSTKLIESKPSFMFVIVAVGILYALKLSLGIIDSLLYGSGNLISRYNLSFLLDWSLLISSLIYGLAYYLVWGKINNRTRLIGKLE